MKPVEDVEGFRAFFADDLQIGLPHVGSNEHDLRSQLISNDGEESTEGLDRPFFSDPEQTRDVEIDLIDQGQVLVAFGVLDFIDTAGVDLPQRPMLQSPRDDMLDRIKNLFPGSAKRLSRFFPGQPARPAGQKEHVGFGQLTFAVTPWNFLDHHRLAAAAIDAAHGVQQEDEKSPERDELETPLGQSIISGRRLVAARTDCRGTLAWPHRDLDALFVGTEAGMLVNETPEVVAAV